MNPVITFIEDEVDDTPCIIATNGEGFTWWHGTIAPSEFIKADDYTNFQENIVKNFKVKK